MVWAGAVFGFHVLRAALGSISEVIGDRFQESLRGHIEEACYRQAQTLPLIELESPDCHDQHERARRGTEDRLFSTMAFLWQSVSNVVALVSLLLFLGTFHWGLPLLLMIGTSPGVLIRARVHRQRYLLHRKQTPDQRRFNSYNFMLTGRQPAKEVHYF